MPSTQQLLDQAKQLRIAGNWPAAEALYRQVLQQDAACAEAHHHLGVVLQVQGQREEASRCYRRSIALRPDYASAYNNLGGLLRELGRLDEAGQCCRKAIALRADSAEAHKNLGDVLRDRGRFEEAAACYRQVLVFRPEWAATYSDLGIVLRELGQLESAADCCRRAIALQGNYAEAHNNLGNVLKDQGRLEEAAEAYRTAIALKPTLVAAYNNMGGILKDQGRLAEATEYYRKAIQLQPAFAEAHSNLGIALQDQGRLTEAMECFDRAIALKPDIAAAHWNRSLQLLRNGRFDEGWSEYEWRWRCKPFVAQKNPPGLRWDGGDVRGRTVLLYSEQGLGDTIQFARYVPLVAQRGARVILQCQDELKSLMHTAVGASAVLGFSEGLPPFDLHCPILSLPLIFRTTLESIPAQVPYLAPPPGRVAHWRQRLAAHGAGLKVGLAWAGNPAHLNDRNRSLPLSSLASLWQARSHVGCAPRTSAPVLVRGAHPTSDDPAIGRLSRIQSVAFYSLQKGEPAKQTASLPAGLPLIDYTPELMDFADTAALIANLDLVICVDTAVAHLAGALAKRAWVLLPSPADWRWLIDRPDSPWYPTMRLFRQSRPGDWSDPLRSVQHELTKLASVTG